MLDDDQRPVPRDPLQELGGQLAFAHAHAGDRLVEQLGSDGLGELYRAQNVHAQKLVRTLRLIRPELAAQPDFRVRLLQVVELLDTLNHPNLLHIHHLGEEGEVLFTVHELLVGRTLRALTTEQPLRRPVSVVADWIYQALCGLGHAHRHGIIHQDRLLPSLRPHSFSRLTAPGGGGAGKHLAACGAASLGAANDLAAALVRARGS